MATDRASGSVGELFLMNQNDAGSPFVRSYASLQKRDVVLGVVSTFRTALAGARTKVEVEAIVSQARDGLQVLQGRWSDRGHFAKSLCQVATAVRRQGWPDVARALLEWALGQRIADPYILNEIAQCHLANDDLIGAEDTLQRARALNLLSEAMYTALLRRYGRAGDTRKARQLLDGAVQDGVAGAFSYTALVAAYGKAGDILQAQEIFERARSRGLLVAAIYTALADAYGKAGHVQESKRVFDEARTYNAIDGRFYTVLMSAYCRIGSLVEARDVFDEALRKGLIDDRTCSVMIGAYVRTGQWLPAGRARRRGSGRSGTAIVVRDSSRCLLPLRAPSAGASRARACTCTGRDDLQQVGRFVFETAVQIRGKPCEA